ncbi:cytochrome P450 [Halioxenophilus sp. WMMB6]|uniref:cytochrome P450 n=1 Tax=Halioxenophilus sp. WMMB6 TaxID=3073815 RepID=UPI00295E9C82|nr:cytochrome P450 [Halioxenophilus sp. WMMB6]
MTTENIESRDYFTDQSVLLDPNQYFKNIFSQGPVYRIPGRDYLMVTGFDECVAVVRNTDDFSSIFSFSPYGAGTPLPFEPKGDDISEQLEAFRQPTDLLVTQDGQLHAANRSILAKLFTPTRLRDNEIFMTDYARGLAADVVGKGECEFIQDVALPFGTNVISDLLGVPMEDRQLFMDVISASPPPGAVKSDDVRTQIPHFEFMLEFFTSYIKDRRANPRPDVLHELATARYPDGSIPDLMEIAKLAMFLFVGGRGSSAKFLATCLMFVAEDPGIQQKLRVNRELIPTFIEEVLRLQGTTKATFRLARRKTKIGDVDIPAGTKVVLLLGAANRDPRRWENPDEFQMGRPKIREHLAFGRGAHTCAGAPLARTEARVVINQFLDHCSDISLNEAAHGKTGNRDLQFEPSYIVRGLSSLHLVLTP